MFQPLSSAYIDLKQGVNNIDSSHGRKSVISSLKSVVLRPDTLSLVLLLSLSPIEETENIIGHSQTIKLEQALLLILMLYRVSMKLRLDLNISSCRFGQ